MMHPRVYALLWVLVAVALHASQAQPTANTPGGIRVIDKHVEDGMEKAAGSASGVPSAGPAASRGQGQQGTVDSESEVDSGQLLFQSIPSFPETESQALETFTGILRTPAKQLAGGSRNDQQGAVYGADSGSSAADDFIQALLKTTRASLASSRMQHTAHGNDQETDDTSDGETVDADYEIGESNSAAASAGPVTDGFATAASADLDPEAGAAAEPAPGSHAEPAAAAADMRMQDTFSGQRIADAASAVEGQVLVTQAEIIPSVQHHSQVVLTSLKMRPMLAQELLSKAAVGEGPAAAKAAAWQDSLKQALEAAAALETNTSVAQMHTRMTSIVNLGIELAEPPFPNAAAAAASSVANSIKALTGDESVLVGVSLLRLGSHSSSPASEANTTAAMAVLNSSSAGSSHPVHGHSTAPAAAGGGSKGSMLAMLTLYGVGPPSNAVVILQRMRDACPELFTYGAKLANSTCGRSIASKYFQAVLEAAEAPQHQDSDSTSTSSDSSSSSSGGDDVAALPARALLQQTRGVAFTSSSTVTAITRNRASSRAVATTATTTLTASTHAGTSSGKLAAGIAVAQQFQRSSSSSSSTAPGTGSDTHGSIKWEFSSRSSGSIESVSKHKGQLGESSSEETVVEAASSRVGAAVVQHNPDLAAFVQHSSSCLRVQQQPEVNIIITQAVGVAANQQPILLADRLHQLSSSPALTQLLSLSGLTLAQAGKPQIIDLSAAAAAAGLSRGTTLAAASALGSEAAALGHAWGTIGSGNSSSGGSSTPAPQKQGDSSVATPAVIGVAVAVAVSVVAVSAAAVAIVVVKQRAKQARAAAAEDQQQLPKSSKRRKSSKGKGTTSKYLPTSHPALGHSTPDRTIPPAPSVVVTALSSPCQHTPGQSPSKPRVVLPGHRSAPLASAGSPLVPSGGSGPAAAFAVSSPHHDLISQALTRGDSVSSAVMADFAEQQQRQRLSCADDEEDSNTGEGVDVEELEDQQQQAQQVRAARSAVRQAAALPAGAGRRNSSSSPLRTLPAAAAPRTQLAVDQQQRLRCTSPYQQLRQQWESRDTSSSSIPRCSPAAARSSGQLVSAGSAGQPAGGNAANTLGPLSGCLAGGTGALPPGTAGLPDQLRLFSRRLSESSLPEELQQALSGSSSGASGCRGGDGSAVGSGGGSLSAAAAAGARAARQDSSSAGVSSSGGMILPTLRTLNSVNTPDRSGACSSATTVKLSPFMAYDVGALMGAASPASSLQASFAAAAVAAVASSSMAESSMQLRQGGLSSMGCSSAGPFDPAACLTDGVSTVIVTAAAVQQKLGLQHVQHSGLGRQQEQQQELHTPKAPHSMRATPFMLPGSIPPGLE